MQIVKLKSIFVETRRDQKKSSLPLSGTQKCCLKRYGEQCVERTLLCVRKSLLFVGIFIYEFCEWKAVDTQQNKLATSMVSTNFIFTLQELHYFE